MRRKATPDQIRVVMLSAARGRGREDFRMRGEGARNPFHPRSIVADGWTRGRDEAAQEAKRSNG